MAFGANHLPILSEAAHMSQGMVEGPDLYLGNPLYTKNKARNMGKILPSRFEGRFTPHVREGFRVF